MLFGGVLPGQAHYVIDLLVTKGIGFYCVAG